MLKFQTLGITIQLIFSTLDYSRQPLDVAWTVIERVGPLLVDEIGILSENPPS